MYLDLIKPLKRSDQVLIESKLTEEKERCSKAIKLAEGRNKSGFNFFR